MQNSNRICTIKVTKIYNEVTDDKDLMEVTEKVEIDQINSRGIISPLYEIYKDIGKNPDRFYRAKIYNNSDWEKFETTTMQIAESYFPNFIEEIKYHFSVGRAITGTRNGRIILSAVPNAIICRLSYKEVLSILRFENRASRFIDNAPDAVRYIDPKRVQERLDLGDYMLESWGQKRGQRTRRHYSYLTFSNDAARWLDQMK